MLFCLGHSVGYNEIYNALAALIRHCWVSWHSPDNGFTTQLIFRLIKRLLDQLFAPARVKPSLDERKGRVLRVDDLCVARYTFILLSVCKRKS